MSFIPKFKRWQLSLKAGLIKAGFIRPPGPKEAENIGPEEQQARQTLLHLTEQRRPGGFRR